MNKTAVARFWKYVEVSGHDACWPWSGAKTPRGYGTFSQDGLRAGSRTYAHRFSWRLANAADIPAGMHVLHSCDNPPCCNPAHLRVGTRSDNARDMYSRGRYPVRRGERVPAGKLTEHIVRELRARRLSGESYAALANAYDVSHVTAWCIGTRRTWRHVE